jgi:hypothetical protein
MESSSEKRGLPLQSPITAMLNVEPLMGSLLEDELQIKLEMRDDFQNTSFCTTERLSDRNPER